jgi:hypothetical protein
MRPGSLFRRRRSVVAAAALWCGVMARSAQGQPARAPSTTPPVKSPMATDAAATLRQANASAQVGDWPQVERFVAQLATIALGDADRAELHRLRGLAAFFARRLDLAEADLLVYLRLDADAHLDPATVPPEAITFFESVQAKHRAELRRLHATPAPPPKRSYLLALLPVAGQLQNGDRRKAWAFGATLGALATTNLASYVVLRRWCRQRDGTCDRSGVDRTERARQLSVVNLVSGVALLVVYGVEVYDAISGLRRRTVRITPTFEQGRGSVWVGVSF